MAAEFPKLHSLRLLQLSLGCSLEGLSSVQLGLERPQELHDIFEGHTRQSGPPSYRVRLCRRCSGCAERVDKGTYDTLEDACLVQDAWQLELGTPEKCHVLVPGDEEWVKCIAVLKLARRMQSIVTVGSALYPSSDSEDAASERGQHAKRSASELVPHPMYNMSHQRDGLGILVSQFLFFERAIARSFVRDNILITNTLQALATAMKLQHRRKAARLMQEAVTENDGSTSVLPRSAIILLQATMLRWVLLASLQVPLLEIPGLVRRVQALAPAVPVADLLEEINSDLESPHTHLTHSSIERAQVLAASTTEYVMAAMFHTLCPKESELDHDPDIVWAVVDKASKVTERLHALFQALSRLMLRGRENPFAQEAPESFEGTIGPMLMNAMRMIAMGVGPMNALLVFFSPSRATACHLSKQLDDLVAEERLFPTGFAPVRALVRENYLFAFVAKLKLENNPLVDTRALSELDTLALCVISARYNQFGALKRDAQWRAEGPPDTEFWALSALLAFACFRPGFVAHQQSAPIPEYVTRDNVFEVANQRLQNGDFDDNWCQVALQTFYPQFTLQHVLDETSQALSEYSAFAQDMRIGFITHWGIVAIAMTLRLVKHHCYGVTPQVVQTICDACERLLDLSNQRFRIVRLLEPLLEQPLYVMSTSSDDYGVPRGLSPRVRSIAEVMREAFDDPAFDEFYNLT